MFFILSSCIVSTCLFRRPRQFCLSSIVFCLTTFLFFSGPSTKYAGRIKTNWNRSLSVCPAACLSLYSSNQKDRITNRDCLLQERDQYIFDNQRAKQSRRAKFALTGIWTKKQTHKQKLKAAEFEERRAEKEQGKQNFWQTAIGEREQQHHTGETKKKKDLGREKQNHAWRNKGGEEKRKSQAEQTCKEETEKQIETNEDKWMRQSKAEWKQRDWNRQEITSRGIKGKQCRHWWRKASQTTTKEQITDNEKTAEQVLPTRQRERERGVYVRQTNRITEWSEQESNPPSTIIHPLKVEEEKEFVCVMLDRLLLSQSEISRMKKRLWMYHVCVPRKLTHAVNSDRCVWEERKGR